MTCNSNIEYIKRVLSLLETIPVSTETVESKVQVMKQLLNVVILRLGGEDDRDFCERDDI